MIPHSRQIQYYTATGRFTHHYLDPYLKICLSNRKACFIFASSCLYTAQIVPSPSMATIMPYSICSDWVSDSGRVLSESTQHLTTAIEEQTNRD